MFLQTRFRTLFAGCLSFEHSNSNSNSQLPHAAQSVCGAKSAKSGLQEHFIPSNSHAHTYCPSSVTSQHIEPFLSFSLSFQIHLHRNSHFYFYFLSFFILAELVPIELVTDQCYKTNKKIKPGNHIVTLVQKGVKEVQIYTIFIFVFLVI